MNLLHLWISLLFIFALIRWGDYKNWKSYYPTILFISTGDLIYNFWTKDDKLWQWYSPVFTHTFIDFLWLFTVFPATILIYLPNFPKENKRKFIYVFYFIIIYSLIEYLIFVAGYIKYFNGWSYWNSFLFYFAMFPVLRLHQKRPILAWIVYFILAFSILHAFEIPLKLIN